MLSGTVVDVAITDSRVDTSQSASLKANVADVIRRAYPSASVNFLPEDQYYADAAPNRVTIKIAIAAYVSGFGRSITTAIGSVGGTFSYGVIPEGHWNGLAGFVLQVFDKRDGARAKVVKPISKLVSKPNTFGFKTAHDALIEAQRDAEQELLLAIDSALLR